MLELPSLAFFRSFKLQFFIFYTVGPRFTAPLREYLIDYLKRKLRCFEYFFVLVGVLDFHWFRNQTVVL